MKKTEGKKNVKEKKRKKIIKIKVKKVNNEKTEGKKKPKRKKMKK